MKENILAILTTFGGGGILGYLLSIVKLYLPFWRERIQTYNEILAELIEICNMLGDFERYVSTDFGKLVKEQVFEYFTENGIQCTSEDNEKIDFLTRSFIDNSVQSILIKANDYSVEKLNAKIDKLSKFDPMMYYQMINLKLFSVAVQKAVSDFSEEKNIIMTQENQDAKDSCLYFGRIGARPIRKLRFQLYDVITILVKRCGIGKKNAFKRIKYHIEYYVENPIDISGLRSFIDEMINLSDTDF